MRGSSIIVVGERHDLDRLSAIERHDVARQVSGRIDRLPGAQAREVELIDDAGVAIGDEVDDDVVAVLVGVDVVEGEDGIGDARGDEARRRPCRTRGSAGRAPASSGSCG